MNLLGAVGDRAGAGPRAAGDRAARSAAVGAVPGRFEQVRAGQPFLVVVDYAHTPDALERVLATARKLTPRPARRRVRLRRRPRPDQAPDHGRDRRARSADRAWVTSDNPRSERPEAIIDEIVVGVRRVGRRGRAAT